MNMIRYRYTLCAICYVHCEHVKLLNVPVPPSCAREKEVFERYERYANVKYAIWRNIMVYESNRKAIWWHMTQSYNRNDGTDTASVSPPLAAGTARRSSSAICRAICATPTGSNMWATERCASVVAATCQGVEMTELLVHQVGGQHR